MCRTNKMFDDYYFTVYSFNDDYICGFDEVETLSKFLDMKLKYVLYYLKNNINFTLNGKLVKVYVYKKEKNIESKGKRI